MSPLPVGSRLVVFVPGTPVPQGSMTRSKFGGIHHSNPALPWWRLQVAEYARRAAEAAGLDEPIEDAVGMRVDFVFARPAAHYGTGRNAKVLKSGAPQRPIKPPDLDKLLRAILDAMSIDAKVLADDSQVVWVQATKQYADASWPQGPGVSIQIGVMR